MRIPVPQFLVARLVARAKRTPYFHLAGYMNRWWLFGAYDAPGVKDGPRRPRISARIHEILRSDDERALHDHPWNYLSVILRGGYFEITPKGRRWYGPGSVLFRRAESLHRLEVHATEPTVTLFITGRKRRSWGFQTPLGWVHWREYAASAPQVAARTGQAVERGIR